MGTLFVWVQSMRLRFLWIGFCCVVFSSLSGQVFVKPAAALIMRSTAVEVTHQKDLDFIKSNLDRFYGLQRIRVSGNVDVSRVCDVLPLLDDLDEVQLLKFSGTLNDEDVEHLTWVNQVSIWLKNGREDQILFNDRLGRLNRLTLIFEVVPDNYDFMQNWKVRGLKLIAPYVKKELPAAIRAAARIKGLREFGISVDAIADLPADISSIAALEKLSLTDNLSWLNEKYPDDLPLLRQRLEIDQNNKLRYIGLIYHAQEAVMMPWEMKHITSLFPNARLAPWASVSGDTTLLGQFSEFVPCRPNESARLLKSSNAGFLPQLDAGTYLFEGDNQQDRVFYLNAEAALLVPKGAVETQDGQSIDKDYQLQCILQNKPSRFMCDGFPLNYDSAGRNYNLAPGIVFHVRAIYNHKELRIKEGYSMRLMFLSQTDTAHRFYAFNTARKKWQHFYDYDYDFDDSKNKPIDYYAFYAGKKTALEMYPSDNTTQENRFETEGYFYLLDPGVNKVSLENSGGYWVAPVKDRVPAMGSYSLRRGRGLVGLRKEFVDKKKEKNIIRFTVLDRTETLFPELKPLQNYPLEIESSMDPKEFSTLFIRGAIYADIRFSQSGGAWFMDLRTETGYWRFTLLQPKDKVKKQTAKSRSKQTEFLSKMSQYTDIRQKKELALVMYHSRFKESGIQQAKRMLMYGQVKPRGQSAYSFNIRSTGTFAWAKPVSVSDTGRVDAKFTNKDGIPIDVKQAWVAHYKPFNYRCFGAADIFALNISPANLAYIAAKDQAGRMYYLSPEKYRALGVKSNSLMFLPLEEMPRQIQNLKELETLIGAK
ncbi:MAG: hypothetical protein RLZZ161_604 [Bacteroidota bacterium]